VSGALSAGAVCFLIRPFTLQEDLLTGIRSALNPPAKVDGKTPPFGRAIKEGKVHGSNYDARDSFPATQAD